MEDDDESLCAACLALPEELDAHEQIARTLAAKVEIAQLYRACKGALRLARIYMREAQTVDARARACLTEVAEAREQIRVLRGGEPRAAATPSERPGLRKAQLPQTSAGRLRAVR
jgi:hypothetical protein